MARLEGNLRIFRRNVARLSFELVFFLFITVELSGHDISPNEGTDELLAQFGAISPPPLK